MRRLNSSSILKSILFLVVLFGILIIAKIQISRKHGDTDRQKLYDRLEMDIKLGNLDTIKSDIEQGADIHGWERTNPINNQPQHMDALIVAMSRSQPAEGTRRPVIVDYILDRILLEPIKPVEVDNLLAAAVFCNRQDLISRLLPKCSRQGQTEALRNAALYGRIEMVQFLLNNGVSQDNLVINMDLTRGDPISPRIVATQQNDQENKLSVLLDVVGKQFKNKSEILTLLLKHGARINTANNQGRSPLQLALSLNDWQTFDLLLRHGANINYIGPKGSCAVGQAAWSTNPEILTYLLSHGADLHIRSEDGYTPLHQAVEQGSPPSLDLLLRAGADINAKAQNGETPLHIAASSGREWTCEWLITHGAKTESRTADGLTPLMASFKQSPNNYYKSHVYAVLLDHGADWRARDKNGTSVFMYAAQNQHVEAINQLLRKGAHVNDHNLEGKTALMFVCEQPMIYPHLVQLLLKHGADPNARGRNGESTLQIARKNTNQDVIRILQDAGARD